MEFALVVAVAGAVAGWRWWRQGKRLKEIVFFGTVRAYTQFWHRWWMQGGDPLPPSGPVLVVSNHTCSADPPLLQTASRRVFCWLASREQYDQHWLVRKLFDTLHCVPINRNGRDAVAARAALQRLREGRVVCVFPEGNLSGVCLGRMRAPKAGAAWLALRSDAVVIPAYIAGGPQTHDLLPAWALPSRRGARVRFGPPIDLSDYRGRRISRQLLEEVSALLMGRIQALAPRRLAGAATCKRGETVMASTAQQLASKHCQPCEGGVPPLSKETVQQLLKEVPGWRLTPDGQRLRREWRVKDFQTGLDFFNRVGQIAESEDHHPDLHLTGYRNAAIELSTHAIGGLSENDFILAAKIDKLPVELKQ